MATNITKTVADSMAMDIATLKRIAKTAPFKYKQYTIPKRNNKGVRWIAQPTRHIKICQRQVVKELSKTLRVSDTATAYIEGRNIAYNARKHCENKYLLKLDFSDFFNSIKPWMLFMVMEQEGIELSAVDKSFLENMLFFYPERYAHLCLSVGAPSSPFISNFIMKPFDETLYSLCKKNNIVYTRYADDLTFSISEKGLLFALPEQIKIILKEEYYGAIKIHPDKTVHSSKKYNRHVTGLTLTNDSKISIGRDRKRQISSMVHKFKLNALEEEKKSRLTGLIAFALDVEPKFIERLVRKYGISTIDALLQRTSDE